MGRRSLLDLLSAQNDFIGAKSQIINAQYSQLFAKYRILDALGTLVTTIAGETNTVYAQVGLAGAEPENEDTLPVYYDKDQDLIVDEEDICNSSLLDEMKGIYGCKLLAKDTQRIERYMGFLFEDESDELTDDGAQMLENLIKQLAPYEFAYLKFDILGHGDVADMTMEELLTLSDKRAKTVQNKLIEAGALKTHITTHAKANKAPMFSDESGHGVELNNRVDIIVHKLKK